MITIAPAALALFAVPTTVGSALAVGPARVGVFQDDGQGHEEGHDDGHGHGDGGTHDLDDVSGHFQAGGSSEAHGSARRLGLLGLHLFGHAHNADAASLVMGDVELDLALVVDAVVDWSDPEAPDQATGFDLDLRVFELDLEARWDDWLGYAVVVGDEEIELEEAAAVFTGWRASSVRAGRFFADFGAQMRMHVHELPYPERPGVLAEYLGEELPGTGVQFDLRSDPGSAGTVRFSLGVFSELGGDHGHGDDEDGGDEPAVEFGGRRAAGDLAFTARLAHRFEPSDSSLVEWGVSARHLADFAFTVDAADLEASGFDSTVLGIDGRLGLAEPGRDSGWALGGEFLLATGTTGAEFDAGSAAPGDESIVPFGRDVSGWYAFAERRFDSRYTGGILAGAFEHPEPGTPRERELIAYLSKRVGSDTFLRCFVGRSDSDEEGEGEVVRIGLRLTATFGPHSHDRWGGFGGH